MIERPDDYNRLQRALNRSRVVALLGPRQCGKTTLARQLLSSGSLNYFDLEEPRSLARLQEPELALAPLRGLVVIDEVQRCPELFPLLRVLADRRPLPARFLLLGSASPSLLRQSSESLAGRIETLQLDGLSLRDVGAGHAARHWLRGGFPKSFIARSEADSLAWRTEFIKTYIERDVPQLGFSIPSATLRRFWAMVAHYHAQIWNGSELARALGLSEASVRRYVDIFTDLFLVRQLQPWHENLAKRQVKSPKVFIRDTGLLHALLGIHDRRQLEEHPKVGASWEGYAVDSVIRAAQIDQAYYWATYTGAELDLLFTYKGRRIGVEVKRADAPKLTPSMRTAMTDLRLDRLYVAYPGNVRYTLMKHVEAIGLDELLTELSAKRVPGRS
jgi:uncharacterized protein